MSLENKTLKGAYKDLLQMDNSNNGVDNSIRNVKDGEGTASALFIRDDSVRIFPANADSSSAFSVRANSGSNVFIVDTTNELVRASGNIVNTQYIYYGNTATNAFYSANTHHPVGFGNYYGASDLTNPPSFGTGTDPATSFTTAEGTATRASDLVQYIWYVADNITIDAVYSIEGADTATGDTTRMHLFSYDFGSGSTSALTNGTLLAHNSDVTNAGYEQPYLSTWTVDSSDVVSGKVILAAFRSDSNNSDYSLTIKVKYHLT